MPLTREGQATGLTVAIDLVNTLDEAEGLAAVAAFATAGLLEAFRDLGWQRFGRCDASPCRCAYVDRSKNRTRRYCSGLCADRVAQAQYRARKKARPAR